MKKFLRGLFTVFCCVMFLTSCGSEETEYENSEPTRSMVASMNKEESEAVPEISEEEETYLEVLEVIEEEDAEELLEESDADETEVEMPVVEEIVEEPKPAYSYTDLNQTMYASSSVNIRSLPSTEGTKLGGLAYAQAVTVTGKCNENGWYRIAYKGSEAYVSGSYLVNDKPVVVESSTASSSSGNSSSNGSSGNSVTVPTHEDNVGNLVWVPTKGGKKYHSNSGCSGMEGPMQVTVEHAGALGFTPCKRCH